MLEKERTKYCVNYDCQKTAEEVIGCAHLEDGKVCYFSHLDQRDVCYPSYEFSPEALEKAREDKATRERINKGLFQG